MHFRTLPATSDDFPKSVPGRGLKYALTFFDEPTGDDEFKRRRLKTDQLDDIHYGLLKDYLRLKSFPTEGVERLLVLVIQKTAVKPDKFGEVIQEVQLTDAKNERSVEYHGALVRIWNI